MGPCRPGQVVGEATFTLHTIRWIRTDSSAMVGLVSIGISSFKPTVTGACALLQPGPNLVSTQALPIGGRGISMNNFWPMKWTVFATSFILLVLSGLRPFPNADAEPRRETPSPRLSFKALSGEETGLKAIMEKW